MGGLSRSALSVGSLGASWRGVLRSDGGGFCGQRTRPFSEPLNLSGAEGLYLDCALLSDDDVDRRAWKMSLRTDEGRGEVVYQAAFQPSVGTAQRVKVPFSDFRLVRGPLALAGAPPLSNLSAVYQIGRLVRGRLALAGPPPLSNLSAVYQIGFTVSKFVISEEMTMLENFRNGSFHLGLAEIGSYSKDGSAIALKVKAMDQKEVQRRRNWVQKLIFPVLGIFFNEARRRRKRAAQLLERRGLGPWRRLRFAWRRKRESRSVLGTSLGLTCDAVASAGLWVLALPLRCILFPIFRLQARRERKKLDEKLAEKADPESGPRK
eukprot:Skav233312  [mRNA]  locus=scaffold3767:87341:88303:- [translate_table: standard]